MATVSGLVGALAVICGGAAPAYADDTKGACTISDQGDIICVKKSEVVRKDKDAGYVVRQKQDCSTTERPRFILPNTQAASDGKTQSGPSVECNNRAELPKGVKLPKFKF
ncbi:hypothetical protein SZN_08229 [Streptomyces zinciresistens K42]|uniref:Secreted protein n=2 Tax=Streptomyces TaxID=1883 RepID=G2G832_9ACTN|nr:hypothetical protein SZN_08229 [Streptomyces zinciresistens K42]